MYRPIDYTGVPAMRAYDVLVAHTIVGHDPAPAAHFSVGSAGELTQSRDTYYQSAACYTGNPRCLAVETEDTGEPFPLWSGNDVPAWTAAQCETLAELCAWAHQKHGIPLVLAPDSKPTSRGIAPHRWGIDGNWAGYAYGGRVPGGELWSTKYGKGCPGDRRIRQLIEIVIPRARELASGKEECMAIFNQDAKNAYDEAYHVLVTGKKYAGSNLQIQLGFVVGRVDAVQAALAAALAEGDLDPDAVVARIDTAVRESTERTITNNVLPALTDVVRQVLGEDNTEQAEAIVTTLAERLRPVA